MQKIGIIIPCYNEALRLESETFIRFSRTHTDTVLIFVNDGSTDETGILLEKIKNQTSRIEIVSLQRNSGKGEAIRQGFLYALKGSFSYAGYLDADLSTTLEDYYSLARLAAQNMFDMVLGSRIKKIDTQIERSLFRHLIGRILATAIDLKFKLGIYDTQCGAKVFRTTIIEGVIQAPFYTRWFFDIEILLRLKKADKKFKATEVALPCWQNKKNSKINVFLFPLIIKEITVLLRRY